MRKNEKEHIFRVSEVFLSSINFYFEEISNEQLIVFKVDFESGLIEYLLDVSHADCNGVNRYVVS